MADYSNSTQRSLEYAPTWALATVSTVFVVISFAVERSLHRLGNYLYRTKRKALYAALQKMKDELMLVGFISLTITLLRNPVSKICISSSLYDKWTPCKISSRTNATAVDTTLSTMPGQKYSAWAPSEYYWAPVNAPQHGRRLLADAATVNHCAQGYEPFVSATGLDQLHIFIFVLVAAHVFYSCITMILAMCKVYTWGPYEKEAHAAVDNNNKSEEMYRNIALTRQSTFVRYHTSRPWSRTRAIVWVICFFQQMHFPQSDYMALRLSFVATHKLRERYNFHAYMIRCMEDEFETIVGISAWLWGFVIIFLLFNVNGANLYFWSSFVPIFVILAIGTKLQHVIASLALEHERSGPFVGALLKPRDELFWFHRPKLLLYVIHLVLFQNAFELATFLWQLWQFGFKSCFIEGNKVYVYVRLVVGLAVQLFCSFSTLPLYALVSQMGSNPKKAVLPSQVGRALESWHKDAKKRLKSEASDRRSADRGESERTLGRISTEEEDEIEPTQHIGSQSSSKSRDIENQEKEEEEEEDDIENMMDPWDELHGSPPIAIDIEDEQRTSSTHRIMSIENLQRESSTTDSKNQQLQGSVEQITSDSRVQKPRQISVGRRKLPMAHESHEEISTKSGLPPGTPSDYLRRRVLPMDNESSSPHEQYVAGNLNPLQVHMRPDSSGLTSAQLQLQRQHQSL